ncbi:MAG: hypothetical protein LC800_20710 [Acidobacteria bacterium]|nr:hypothetical protein [Acidobacteriota bacterium]
MSVNIALPTTRIPHVTLPGEEVVAIIDLTPERAKELLELMDDITVKATKSSKAFKISSFEPSALYVPAHALEARQRPGRGDFIVLDDNFTVSDITPVKVVHADVMPLFVTWEAYDQDEQFKLTTAELDHEILRLVARGETLAAGSTSRSVKNGTRPANEIILVKEYNYVH